MPLIVVKVGGSLLDMPDLGTRLRRWLNSLAEPNVLLVPGGGAAAEVVRVWQRTQQFTDEDAHWLALRAMAFNAYFLATLLPGTPIVNEPTPNPSGWAILDGYAFARSDEGQPGRLPHSWDVTSDSLAARAAIVAGARLLILLKSITLPEPIDWNEAGRRGWVDRAFAQTLGGELRVRGVNLREWSE